MFKYGEIYIAALPSQENNCVQQDSRPVIIVSNDKNNIYSNTVNVVPLSSNRQSLIFTHMFR